MMIAELSAFDPPILIASVMACLMFLFIGANSASEFWRNIKDKPTGGEVMETARKEFQPKGHYVKQSDFELHVTGNKHDHDGIFSKIGGVERGANAALENKIEIVRKDLVIVGNQVSGLKAQTDMQNQQLSRMESTMRDMPSKIVADLVNAKNL